MGHFSYFRRGQIAGAHLAAASVNKPATLLGVSKSGSLQGYDDIHKSWEDVIS
jgi:hypothetical protein